MSLMIDIPLGQVDQDAAHCGQLRRADHGNGTAAVRRTIQHLTLCFLSRVRCPSISRRGCWLLGCWLLLLLLLLLLSVGSATLAAAATAAAELSYSQLCPQGGV